MSSRTRFSSSARWMMPASRDAHSPLLTTTGERIEAPLRLIDALAAVASLERAVAGVGDAVLPEEAVHLPPAVAELASGPARTAPAPRRSSATAPSHRRPASRRSSR